MAENGDHGSEFDHDRTLTFRRNDVTKGSLGNPPNHPEMAELLSYLQVIFFCNSARIIFFQLLSEHIGT